MQTASLEQRWYTLFPKAEQAVARKEFQSLCSRYAEPHRHYHTLEHVAACLQWLDEVREAVPDPAAVEMALWFHDVVYNARKQNNEFISAEYAVATLSLLKVERALRNEVKTLVLVTQHPAVPATDNQRWMLDIDLAILGAAPQHYEDYAQRVRQEYQHVPEALYAAGRKQVLSAFLAMPRLYHTDHFFAQLEACARSNLQREMDRL